LAIEVDDHRLLGLAVAMDASDPLLDALRVPGQVVVDERVGELEVEALGPRLGGDEHLGPSAELVDEREARRDLA
jgi:hypothetical protein